MPKFGIVSDDRLSGELINLVRKKISPIATPDRIQWAKDLPKTRSEKIMRRILRKIVNGEVDSFGDISTLANPEAIQAIVTSYSSHVG
ncbi:AMP-binding enzyme [Coxiella-like endosymbiont of Rhipicephalus sanguineus]|uniref:AMP-binding enzyme n=1 Tax=Coxiella-like endosymbiont of Rhipicephalus sanguineus TaxID=1955402 RepID=UPI00203ACD9C|nr:hypothetical protein [Coxiella-like endosymbiont of Rhipicephalus sanguineus]